jgi:hypothetical protein
MPGVWAGRIGATLEPTGKSLSDSLKTRHQKASSGRWPLFFDGVAKNGVGVELPFFAARRSANMSAK